MQNVYAVNALDSSIRFESTSGGLFSCIANHVLESGGSVCGAAFDENLKLKHVLINKSDELNLLRRSKYLASDAFESYKEIKKVLDEGKEVLFVGTPCQVSGLLSFLERKYENLITVDFICRGVNSPKAFEQWLKENEHTVSKTIKSVWFKYKVGGWKSSPTRTRIDYIDNSFVVLEGSNNLYMSAYLVDNIMLRPCCEHCKFKGLERNSDLTLGDFWGLHSKLDDDKGTSILFINSKKGFDIFNSVSKYVEYEKECNFDYSNNPMFIKSVKRSRYTKKFLIELDKHSFSTCLYKYRKIENRFYKRVIRKIFIRNKQ